MNHFIVIPHLKIQNANALSSPFTIGFPAMTAWLGGVHALQRKLNEQNFQTLAFTSVGVVCHNMELQTFKGHGDFVHSIIGTSNPLDKDGKRPSFIEEPRCHLDVSIVMIVNGFNELKRDTLLQSIEDLLTMIKFASGDLIEFKKPRLETSNEESDDKKLLRSLMPGYAIIERRDLMIEAMENGQDALDALLDSLTIKSRSVNTDGKISWSQSRKQLGWIVPIATGFHGISTLAGPGKTLNQRDPTVPHRFAESVVTLGEFVMPYRLDCIQDILWQYRYDKDSNLYLCQNWEPESTTKHSIRG